MAVENKAEKVGEALLKVALGCRVEEVTEEYAEVDGELKLTKRRETRKDIPPDLKAVQMLLAAREEDYASMSDEELNAERARLLEALRKESREESAAPEGAENRASREDCGRAEGGALKKLAAKRRAARKKSRAIKRRR